MDNLIAKFTISNKGGYSPLVVNFTNISEGDYTRCLWDFGDGSISTTVNATHTYENVGTYNVTLKIMNVVDESIMESTSTPSTIVVIDSTSSATTSQESISTTKRFSTGQVAVRKTVVDGSNLTTIFPLTASTGGFATTNSHCIPMIVSASTGSSFAQVHYNASTYSTLQSFIANGYDSYLGIFLKSGTTVANGSCGGHQLFMYKMLSATGGLITLDRPTPNIGIGSVAATTPFAAIAIYSWTGTNESKTLVPNSSYESIQCSPSIDGLGTLDLPSMYTHNVVSNGTFNYFESNEGTGGTKLFIFPSYSGWNTVESWKPSTVRLSLPYVMWHDKTTSGVNLIDSSETMIDANTNLKYSNLKIENNEAIVGRVFHENKMLVIDDLELQASLNWLSNRNYTLPPLVVTSTSTSDPDGGLQTGYTYFVTYRVRDTAAYSASQFGNTSVQPLHCRYIKEITPSRSGYKFRVQATPSVWQTASRGTVSTGFTSSNVDILIASAATGSTLADVTNWYYTGGVTPTQLRDGVNISFSTGNTMYPALFSSLSISGNSNFKFADDPTIFGYFSATAQSTIYKMSTTLVARNTEFNTTQNETFDSNVNESVFITEAALYNENNELLMIGKLNNPIEKNDKKFVTIKMELDL